MTSTASTTQNPASKDNLFQAVTANEWGQVAGLEPHGNYFVIRRPTKELTKEKSQQFMSDVLAFLHQQRELTEKQAREFNEKYGAPAKARAQDLREKVEKRFDELTREFETRVEKLEHELGERADRIFAKAKPQNGNGGNEDANASSQADETPGEMPRGDDATTTATSTASEEAKGGAGAGNKKKGQRRTE